MFWLQSQEEAWRKRCFGYWPACDCPEGPEEDPGRRGLDATVGVLEFLLRAPGPVGGSIPLVCGAEQQRFEVDVIAVTTNPEQRPSEEPRPIEARQATIANDIFNKQVQRPQKPGKRELRASHRNEGGLEMDSAGTTSATPRPTAPEWALISMAYRYQ